MERALLPGVFWLPEDADASERALYASNHPELAGNIQSLIEREKAKDDAMTEDIRALSAAINDINKQHGAAEAVNRLFDELREKAAHLDVLTGEAAAW